MSVVSASMMWPPFLTAFGSICALIGPTAAVPEVAGEAAALPAGVVATEAAAQ